MNFHYEFPNDYRTGPFWYHLDATKWTLRVLYLFGVGASLFISQSPR